MTFYEPLIGHVNEKWLSNFPNLPSVMFLKIFLKLIVDLIELFLEWLPDQVQSFSTLMLLWILKIGSLSDNSLYLQVENLYSICTWVCTVTSYCGVLQQSKMLFRRASQSWQTLNTRLRSFSEVSDLFFYSFLMMETGGSSKKPLDLLKTHL